MASCPIVPADPCPMPIAMSDGRTIRQLPVRQCTPPSPRLCGRVSGITAYIRDMVRFICERLVSQLERRPVSCAEERDAVAGLLTVLLHRWNEATREPAGVRT